MLLDYLNSFMWYALIVTAILFSLSGLDEVFFDVTYWSYRIYQYIFYRHDYPLQYSQLKHQPEQLIAIMVPCWREHLVIGRMLRHNVEHIDYKNYHFFVGVYPNDYKTVKAVRDMASRYSNIHCVIGSRPGPTKKADNLNGVYDYILRYEREYRIEFKIFLMHDSEDVIHPKTLRLYNFAIPKFDMVQTPVLPIKVGLWQFTHWIYNDEFAELHTKDVIVRGIIGSMIPSAGVGTAFSRRGLASIAGPDKAPFHSESLTEDYDLALRLHLANLKTKFFTYQAICEFKKRRRWLFFGKEKFIPVKEIVATRSLFPRKYRPAVRQRTRWTTGIALQEWYLVGWPGNFRTKYILFHDRKAIFVHAINGFGYIIFIYWVLNYFSNGFFERALTLLELLNANPWVFLIIFIPTLMMLNRSMQRCIATGRVYGFLPALLSIPRTFYANILNLHTAISALRAFFRPIQKTTIKWDKTENTFPTSQELKLNKTLD